MTGVQTCALPISLGNDDPAVGYSVSYPFGVAGPILFLASDLATFMTGEVVNVNGGAVLVG